MNEKPTDTTRWRRYYARKSRAASGTGKPARTESPRNTSSRSERSATGLGSQLATLVRGYVYLTMTRLRMRLTRSIQKARLMRVDHLRGQAYNGGDVDRYVKDRIEYWRRYEQPYRDADKCDPYREEMSHSDRQIEREMERGI